MSLFPAYAIDANDIIKENNDVISMPQSTSAGMSLALETELLASDSEHEESVQPVSADPPADNDYYLDKKWDCGNLRVSTLYYPGRPRYEWTEARRPLGAARGAEAARRGRRRRYYDAAGLGLARDADAEAAAELAARTDAYRRMIDEDPDDENLWLRFIDFQEQCHDASAALSAARAAVARLPRASRVRAALHRARAALPPHERLALLRDDLAAPAAAERPELRTELWLRLLATLAESAAGAAELDSAAAAAVAATRALPCAYPHVLYVYGAQLRAAGLWERLTLLLELVTSMNFPPAAFPPPVEPSRAAAAERRLRDAEDEVIGSGLPLSTMWVRVERLRAAAHWRAAVPQDSGGDPQRAPLPADVADLLLPLRDADAAALLLLNALRLARVPLMPLDSHAARAADATGDARGDGAGAGCAGTLLALLRAARRLPAAHAARAAPPAARDLLAAAADPPLDAEGPLGWVEALWDASLEWTAGARREALLCWRLRWLHARALAAPGRDECGRLRAEARAVLKRFAGGSPLAFAQFARVELAAGGAAAALTVALHALRAALRDPACPPHHRLYVARVASEVSGEEGGAAADGAAAAAAWARVCAVLGRALPDDVAAASPPGTLLDDALRTCEERCEELERGFADAPRAACAWDGARALAALLPGAGEWAAARVALAGPRRRRRLYLELRARAPAHPEGEAARFYEQSACALTLWGARERRLASYARALAPLFPLNAPLALACGGAPLWAWERDATPEERARACGAARTHVGALAGALPALLRAAPGAAAARAERACARAARAAAPVGGALLAALRLHVAPHAPRARPDAALYEALHAHPHHKWLYVRGAAWCGGEAGALADALLERQLRLHALPDELAPAPDPDLVAPI